MKQLRKLKANFTGGMISFVIFSLTFLLMGPFTELNGKARSICVFILGMVFWLTLIFGLVFSFRVNKLCREVQEPVGKKKIPAICRFFSNRAAAVADFGLIVGVTGIAVLALYPPEKQYFYFVELFLIVLSLSMHCLLNSNAFQAIQNLRNKNGRPER